MMQLEARDKRALIGGSLAALALLAYLLWPSGEDESNVQLVPADQRQGGAAAPVSTTQVQPPNVIAPPPVAAGSAVPATAMPEGLTLAGVVGSGAIFGLKDGSQRFVARGREVAPGIVLQAVRLRDVILAAGPTSYRLGFGGAPVALQAAAPSASAAGGPAPQLVVSGTGRNALGGPLITQAQQQQMSQQFTAALSPRQEGSRVTGWTIQPGANLLPLSQAGLQPGDVLISVNGEAVLDQEQVAGLPEQIANAHRVEFEFERGGQRMRRSIQVNPRR